jgi:hypothetical protein
MIVTKIALTVGILAILAPFVAAPFHEDFKPTKFDTFGWFDWTIIVGAFVGAISLVLALLAFIWGV